MQTISRAYISWNETLRLR